MTVQEKMCTIFIFSETKLPKYLKSYDGVSLYQAVTSLENRNV